MVTRIWFAPSLNPMMLWSAMRPWCEEFRLVSKERQMASAMSWSRQFSGALDPLTLAGQMRIGASSSQGHVRRSRSGTQMYV